MDYPSVLDAYRCSLEKGLGDLLATCRGPTLLLEAMGYSLLAGGKRLRPVLVLATKSLFPPNGLDPMPAAAAIELVHTYSLIHDDLPAMDNDDLRRGVPTCHRKFGEAVAILAGDALLTEAFRIVAEAYARQEDEKGNRVIAEIAAAAGSDGMVGGQVLDMTSMGAALGREALEAMHRKKTGALLRAAVRIGAILGDASDTDLEALTSYADAIGLAFQVADDILDTIGTQEALGKSVGKDESQGKSTYVSILGMDRSRSYAASLVDDAVLSLARFGSRAEPLRTLARFIAERTS